MLLQNHHCRTPQSEQTHDSEQQLQAMQAANQKSLVGCILADTDASDNLGKVVSQLIHLQLPLSYIGHETASGYYLKPARGKGLVRKLIKKAEQNLKVVGLEI